MHPTSLECETMGKNDGTREETLSPESTVQLRAFSRTSMHLEFLDTDCASDQRDHNEFNGAFKKGSASDDTNDGDKTSGRPLPWRPFWVRPAMLAAFCGLFLTFVVSMIATIIYSRQNDGLFTAHENYRYFWRFGPTAGKTSHRSFWISN